MPAQSSLALYIGKGGQSNTNGFEIDFLNDIHAFNFKSIAIFQGGSRSIKEMTCRGAIKKQEIEVQFW